MEAIVKARKLGGSVAVVVPKEMAELENIKPNDSVRITVERIDEVSSLWGRWKWIRKSTDRIMREIDENED